MIKRKAFTLIELLVVISIIALLLSILMPGLQKAKQHALRMLCRTNLHSYGIAGNMYLMDYDEEFMDPWMSIYDSCQGQGGHEKNKCDGSHQAFPGEPQRFCRWHNDDYSLTRFPEYQGPLWEYLEAEEINLCPVFAKLALKFGENHPLHVASIPFDAQFGYAQNAYLGTDYFEGIRKSSEVKSPARTFFFAEENMWVIAPGQKDYTGLPYQGPERISGAVLNDTALLARVNPGSAGDIADAFATFHSPPGGDYNNGTGNAVMMDGAIEAVTPWNDGTFKKAWPKLGGKFNDD
jgi:prepilin-type N-terminal cleavage/methylation domain-containing protein